MDSTVRSEDFVEVTGGSIVLLSERGELVGAPVRIGPDPCVIGRDPHCQVVVDDPEVSSSHCELLATERGLLVRDLASTNGTFVNQVRVKEGELTTDARLSCGHSRFVVRVTGSERVPISNAGSFGPIIGRSQVMRRLYTQLGKLAPHDLSVLITGETGTGKELVAHAIHEASRRRHRPFIIINCTTIPVSLAESTLFGHEKGAFTGASSRHPSPFVQAQGGTVFFDELGDLPPDIQPKLLRALENREIQSVGSTRTEKIDVRIVAATRKDMHAEVNAERFRNDLFYRFAQAIVEVPPLRARPDDILDLVARFLAGLGDPGAVTRIDDASRDRLKSYDWPGNVRELRNAVAVAYAQSEGGPIDFVELLSGGPPRSTGVLSDRTSLLRPFTEQRQELVEGFERDYFTKLVQTAGGNVSEMARLSGLSRKTVREYLEHYRLRGSE
jgi:DNA-binding NtrC family response regulator